MSESISIAEDAELSPEEKQISFVASKAKDEFRVHSEVSSLTKRLLAHPDFEEESRREIENEVVAVTGLLPVGAMKLKQEARQSNSWSAL